MGKLFHCYSSVCVLRVLLVVCCLLDSVPIYSLPRSLLIFGYAHLSTDFSAISYHNNTKRLLEPKWSCYAEPGLVRRSAPSYHSTGRPAATGSISGPQTMRHPIESKRHPWKIPIFFCSSNHVHNQLYAVCERDKPERHNKGGVGVAGCERPKKLCVDMCV